MYRLTAASGSFTDNNSQSYPFTLAMSYSPSGNITTKNLDAETLLADGSPFHMVYEGNYNYNTNQPHTIDTITGTDIDQAFSWDLNGNLSTHTDNIKSLNRYLCWDEENRLMAVKDQNYLSAYVYDAAGERVWKLSGEVTQMKINGVGTIDVASLSNKTLYVSPYVVYNEQGYSKHYYAGAERVSSRLGGGTIYGLKHPINDTVSPIGSDGKEYHELASRLWGMLQRSFTNCLDLEAGYIGIEHRLNSVEHSAGNDNPEDNWYIYHSDHLGSSSFLTDASGTPTQHLQYLPFGENFIEQRATTDYYTPYTFSAKERDLETGYSYFGARYYDPNVSVWLSVDPMSDEAPGWSPFRYCFQNPLNLVDPRGLFESEADAKNWAKANGIKTGWLRQYKIREKEGKFEIYNKKEGFSYRQVDGIIGSYLGDKGNSVMLMPCCSPEQSKGKLNQVFDRIQTGLDIIGLIPGFGEIADGINAAIYAVRGDYVNAALSVAAMIPVAGWVATGGKIAKKAIKFTNNQQALISIAKEAKRVGGVDLSEAKILQEWATEYNLPYRGPEIHTNRKFNKPHIHVGPVNHIKIK